MSVIEILRRAAEVAELITCFVALVAMLIRPVREKLLGFGAVKEGQRCLLRRAIVEIYYKHLDEKTMRQYEYEVLESCYRAYKELEGNSFVGRIYREMQEWTVVS